MQNNKSDKNMLVVVHGMGEHSANSIKSEIDNSLARLKGWEADKVDLRVVMYDKVFNDWREKAKNDWEYTAGLLEGRVHFTKVKEWMSSAVSVNSPGFFQTHWLDVILYMSTLGLRVQLEVAKQITQLLKEFNNGENLDSRKFVLVGHSLGTAVLHDTLHKMWRGGFKDDRFNTLSKQPISIAALFQIANTSRLLKSGIDPTGRETAVRPYPGALMERMYNIHHRYDPIARIKQFKVKNLNQWLAEWDYPEDSFFDVELTGVHQLNTHSLVHYLSDPQVHCHLFSELFDNYDFPSDYDSQVRTHNKGVILDKVDAVKNDIDKFKTAIEGTNFKRIESMTEIVSAWKQLEEATSWQDLESTIRSFDN